MMSLSLECMPQYFTRCMDTIFPMIYPQATNLSSTYPSYNSSPSICNETYLTSSESPLWWPELFTQLQTTYHNETIKLLLFLRHAEGYHNDAEQQYGTEAWDAYYSTLPEYKDAMLNEKGIQQAENAGEILEKQIQTHGLTIEKVIISPMRRTLQTYEYAFRHLKHIPSICMEDCREMTGLHTCDQRSSITELKEQFPSIEFSLIQTDEDTWYSSTRRETSEEVNLRAEKFLKEIFYNMKETTLAIVTHSEFILAVFRILKLPTFKLRNAEFFPILLREKKT